MLRQQILILWMVLFLSWTLPVPVIADENTDLAENFSNVKSCMQAYANAKNDIDKKILKCFYIGIGQFLGPLLGPRCHCNYMLSDTPVIIKSECTAGACNNWSFDGITNDGQSISGRGKSFDDVYAQVKKIFHAPSANTQDAGNDQNVDASPSKAPPSASPIN